MVDWGERPGRDRQANNPDSCSFRGYKKGNGGIFCSCGGIRCGMCSRRPTAGQRRIFCWRACGKDGGVHGHGRGSWSCVSDGRALAELTLLHVLIAGVGGTRSLRWVAASWAMTASHLGLLEQRRSIGLASVVTLVRANLPPLEHRVGSFLPVLALASDFVDGRIARSTRTETLFGASADALSDAVFWTWFTFTHEPDRRVRIAAMAAWILPALIISGASFGRGQMVNSPRPVILRPSAAMQLVVTIRTLVRYMRRS